jgi:hypothetical protein
MKKAILIVLSLLVSTTNFAATTSEFFNDADLFFKKHISNMDVDYAAIKSNPNVLNDLVKQIESFQFSKDENINKAFLVNAYNLLVINSIVSKYPIKSPLDVAGFFDKTKHAVAGKSYTLNDIENNLIRAKYNDARFHFVLVCGANGCPPIISGAYFPQTIESQLTDQTTKALDNPTFLKVSNGKVLLSQIFEWYKADFGKNVLDFVNKYRTQKLNTDTKTAFYNYDWTVNKKLI